VFAYRRRDARLGITPTVYRAPGYPVLPALFVIIAAYVVISAIWSNPRNAALGAVLIAAGVPAFLFWQRQNRSKRGGDVAVA
jgi:APA family basic amino acid/polyamine antiporter